MIIKKANKKRRRKDKKLIEYDIMLKACSQINKCVKVQTCDSVLN